MPDGYDSIRTLLSLEPNVSPLKVGSFEEAKKAINVGVDAIIIQGREAGGHVIGQDALISLLPRVVDLVGDHDIPVIAAGAIVDAHSYVAALVLVLKVFAWAQGFSQLMKAMLTPRTSRN